jgi:hypothetical protein
VQEREDERDAQKRCKLVYRDDTAITAHMMQNTKRIEEVRNTGGSERNLFEQQAEEQKRREKTLD